MSNSGRIQGANNVRAFEEFIKRHNEKKDWQKYLNNGKSKLKRSLICEECEFTRSVLSQNPTIKSMLADLELELMQQNILKTDSIHMNNFEYSGQEAFVKSCDMKIKEVNKQIVVCEKILNSFIVEIEKLI